MLEQFRDILKREKIKHEEIAKMLGVSIPTYQSSVYREPPPKWLKSFVFAYNLKNVDQDKAKKLRKKLGI